MLSTLARAHAQARTVTHTRTHARAHTHTRAHTLFYSRAHISHTHTHSLPGMPLKFTSALSSQCEDACRSKKACKAYTYHPGQGVCYLKSQVRPGLRGQGCTNDCWFFGVVSSHS